MNILLVEDEIRLVEALGQLLKMQGYHVNIANTGCQGQDMAETGIYDVIILDWMLPDMTGVDLLKSIRIRDISTPVIFLTAKDTISNKIEGLDAGADDYLIKPFDSNELLARVRALSRRAVQLLPDSIITIGLICLNMQQLEVSCKDKIIKLTPKEAQLLELLMRNKNQTLNKELIFDRVWGYDQDAEVSNVELYIFYLRKKIDFSKYSTSLETIRGIGYRLKEV
jgi:DNA-binding response OmpR family regulator